MTGHHLFSAPLTCSLLSKAAHQIASSRMSVCKHLLVLLSLMTRLGVNKVLNSENVKQCIFVLSKHYIVARKGDFYSLFAPVPIVLSHVLLFRDFINYFFCEGPPIVQ